MNDHSIVTIVLLVQLERVLNRTTCTNDRTLQYATNYTECSI